jgi:hypothetical protein
MDENDDWQPAWTRSPFVSSSPSASACIGLHETTWDGPKFPPVTNIFPSMRKRAASVRYSSMKFSSCLSIEWSLGRFVGRMFKRFLFSISIHWLQTKIFNIICKFSERVYNCGHYHKSCDPCGEAKKIKKIYTFGNKINLYSTRTLYYDLYRCNKKALLKRNRLD